MGVTQPRKQGDLRPDKSSHLGRDAALSRQQPSENFLFLLHTLVYLFVSTQRMNHLYKTNLTGSLVWSQILAPLLTKTVCQFPSTSVKWAEGSLSRKVSREPNTLASRLVRQWAGCLFSGWGSSCPSAPAGHISRCRNSPPPTRSFLPKGRTSGTSAGRGRERVSPVTAFGKNDVTRLNPQWAPSQGTYWNRLVLFLFFLSLLEK